MTPEQFAYWMQGFFEIHEPKAMTEKQVQIIKEHLDKVFNNMTRLERWATAPTDHVDYSQDAHTPPDSFYNSMYPASC